MKTYLDLENSTKKLQLEVYYNLGGMNYFTYKMMPRGYYGSCTPVELSENCVSYSAFSGVSTLLVEVKRKNQKAYLEAVKLFETKKLDLIAAVKAKMGIADNGKKLSAALGISLPPRFHNLTEQELRAMPVQVVAACKTQVFANLAACPLDLSRYCGAMYGEINGVPALRFETQEAYKILSS